MNLVVGRYPMFPFRRPYGMTGVVRPLFIYSSMGTSSLHDERKIMGRIGEKLRKALIVHKGLSAKVVGYPLAS